MRLLEALIIHILPDVAPRGETCGNVRLDGQHDHACTEAARTDQADGGEIARTQVGDNEKCHKEYQRGAEVVLQRKTAAADAGQTDEHPQIAFVEQPVERCGAREDVADLCNFRGLQRQRAEAQPRLGAALRGADQQSDGQQADCGGAHEPAHLLCAGQIPQEKAQNEEDAEPHQDRHKLLGQLVRHGRAGDGE